MNTGSAYTSSYIQLHDKVINHYSIDGNRDLYIGQENVIAIYKEVLKRGRSP